MKNISFMLTPQQIRDHIKDVTRRLGWWDLKPGDRLQACVKCQGRKAGEPLEKLAVIEVVSTRPEKLWEITKDDCAREGFPEMEPHEFVRMFCGSMGCDAMTTVNRIEVRYVE